SRPLLTNNSYCLFLQYLHCSFPLSFCFFFFFTSPATPEIYTLSLHDALPISSVPSVRIISQFWPARQPQCPPTPRMKPFMFCRRSEEHTSELQSHLNLVCRLLLEKKKKNKIT